MLRLRACRRLLAVAALILVVPGYGDSGRCAGQTARARELKGLRPLPQASVIFGADNRTLVRDTTVFPFSAIGQVVSNYGNLLLIGTGTMIGDKTVLTAAHVIYDPVMGWPDSITFTPGLNGTIEPYGVANVVAHVVPPAWISGGDEGADVGILVLDTTVGTQTGFLVVDSASDAALDSGLPLDSSGYPADLDNDQQYEASGNSLGVDGNFLLETIDTESGQSGSPIWFVDPVSNAPRVVAVLKGTREVTDNFGNTTMQGVAVRITPDFATLINDTASQNGDTAQTIPVPAVTPTTPTNTAMCGTCGAGTGQALLVCTLGWATCLVSRRRWHP